MASSFYCGLLVGYAHNEEELRKVYKDLDNGEFITDVFKGVDEFLGGGKLYNLIICTILMAFWMTEEYRSNEKLLVEDLSNLKKNLIWWFDIEKPLNINIIDKEDSFDNEHVLFPFKEFYIKKVKIYYQNKRDQIQATKQSMHKKEKEPKEEEEPKEEGASLLRD